MTADHQKGRHLARSSARLAAVQAMYRIDLFKKPVDDVLAEFDDYHLGTDIADADAAEQPIEITSLVPADRRLFDTLVRGCADNLEIIDARLGEMLAPQRRVARLEAILRAIFRVALFELTESRNLSEGVIINEYLNITHAFYDGREPKLVNAILDRVARKLKEQESNKQASADQVTN